MDVLVAVSDPFEQGGALFLRLAVAFGAPDGNHVLVTTTPYDFAKTIAGRKADAAAAVKAKITDYLGFTPAWGEIVVIGL